jgi:hypothetical protein
VIDKSTLSVSSPVDQVKITEAVDPLTSPVSQGLLFSGRVRLAFPGAAIGVGPGVGPGVGVLPPPESELQEVISTVKRARIRFVWYLLMTLIL